MSVATVSRVLNDSGPVRDTTRARVREVARRMQFTPDTTARSLSTRRTNTLGVLLPDVYGEFFSEVMRGVDQTAKQNGFHVLISSAHNQPSEVEAAVHAMRGRVDGLILMASELDIEALALHLPERVPVILMNADHDGSRYDTVDTDNYGGALAMTEHLVSHGHRALRMIRGPGDNRDADQREKGFRAALDAAGIASGRDWVVTGEFTEESGYRATQALLAAGERPTAIFAANDSMAVGALSALRAAGLRVPGDVAVVGFDDIPIAEYMSPPLSTVRVSISTLGARAAELLFTSISAQNRHERTHEVLPTELIIRRSCGTSPTRSPSEEVIP